MKPSFELVLRTTMQSVKGRKVSATVQLNKRNHRLTIIRVQNADAERRHRAQPKAWRVDKRQLDYIG